MTFAFAGAMMALQIFNSTQYPNARCNDGSMGGFYIQTPLTPSLDWVIALDGGFWCWDAASCLDRAKHQNQLTSSRNWSKFRQLGGIFSTDATANPRFAHANKVLIGYCSSDMFWGEGGSGSGALRGFQFQGRNILDATFDFLLTKNLIVNSESTNIVFGGCSAGGQAAVTLAYRQKKILQNKFDFVGNFFVVGDAAWMMDVDPLPNVSNVPIRKTFELGFPLWNATSNNNPCFQAFADRPWQCFFTSTALSFYDGPIFVQASESDGFQVPWNTGSNPPYTTSILSWINSQFTPEIIFQMEKSSATVYAPNCFSHCLSFGDDYFNVKIRKNGFAVSSRVSGGETGISMEQAVRAFIEGNGNSQSYIAQCGSFNCSLTCPLPGQ